MHHSPHNTAAARAIVTLAAALLLSIGAQAQSVAEAANAARQWVDKPVQHESIDAFNPAAKIERRVYAEPRPLHVWIATIDLTQPGIRFALTEPAQFTGEHAEFETRCATTLQFARQRGVQLAINASAFGPFRPRMGMPMGVVGLAAVQGHTYSPPDERFGALYVSRDGQIALKGPPLPRDDVWHVVPGFRMLLDDRKVVVAEKVANSGFGNVNPRTALGTDRKGRTLWIVVADGRQKTRTEGITLVELACLFESLGAWDALNLDGGGSSTLVLENDDGNHRVINTPVGRGEPGSLRLVANNLGLYLPGNPPGLPVAKRVTQLRNAISPFITQDWKVPAKETIQYGSQEVPLPAAPRDHWPTLWVLRDRYRLVCGEHGPTSQPDRWFQGFDAEQFTAFCHAWIRPQHKPYPKVIPPEIRKNLPTHGQVALLQWANLGTPLDHYRLIQRGDFVYAWGNDGKPHAGYFLKRDRDRSAKERLWLWSGKATELVIGQDLDPKRIHAARLVDGPPRPAH